jgi:PAS domain-containing protein
MQRVDSRIKRHFFLESGAWACVIITSVLLFLSLPNLFLMLVRGNVSMVAHQRIAPGEILARGRGVFAECMKDSTASVLPVPKNFQYDPTYGYSIDREALSFFYHNEEGGQGVGASDEQVLLCAAGSLYRALHLADPEALGPDVLWIRMDVGSSGAVLWPAIYNNNKWKQIQEYSSEATKRHREVHDDLITGEKAVSLDQEVGRARSGRPVRLTITIRASSMVGIFKLAIFLNFMTIVVFCGLNWAVQRKLPSEEFVSWYRAWLCWALLYAAYSLVYLIRLSYLHLDAWRPVLLLSAPVFSISNDGFFMVAALSMLQWRNRRERRRLALLSSLVILITFAAGQYWMSAGSKVSSRVIESIYSVVVSGLLGAAFVRLMRRRRFGISGLELIGSRWASFCVASFFSLLAVHQIFIAIWEGWPALEEIFWIFSPVIKMCLMALFFLVELTDRYWREGEVGLAVFNRLEQGVFATNRAGRVINVNAAAVEMLGLTRDYILNKDLREILFRSLFESEEFLADLAANGKVKPRRMLTKDFRGGDIHRFRDVRRLVGAEIVGGARREVTYTLFFLQDEA